VALLPPPEKTKKKDKASKSSTSAGKAKPADEGASLLAGSVMAAPRGMPSGQLQLRGHQGGRNGQALVAGSNSSGDGGVVSDPSDPPKNRPGAMMLAKMRAQGKPGELY
jgi:hypothetical protein